MHLIHGAVALVLAIPLAACGSTDNPEAEPATSATPAQTGYDPCDLLSQAERNKAAGTVSDFEGVLDFYFPTWTCTFGDAPGQTSESSVQYQAMRAGEWAAKVSYIVDTTPADEEPEVLLANVLKRAGRSEEELASLDDSQSCGVWDAVQAEWGNDVEKHLAVYSETTKDKSGHIATAQTCVLGVYAEVSVIADDADTEAGRLRAVRTLALVVRRAETSLPQST